MKLLDRALCALRLHEWSRASISTEENPAAHTIRVVKKRICLRPYCRGVRITAHRSWIGDTPGNVRAEVRRVRLGRR